MKSATITLRTIDGKTITRLLSDVSVDPDADAIEGPRIETGFDDLYHVGGVSFSLMPNKQWCMMLEGPYTPGVIP